MQYTNLNFFGGDVIVQAAAEGLTAKGSTDRAKMSAVVSM